MVGGIGLRDGDRVAWRRRLVSGGRIPTVRRTVGRRRSTVCGPGRTARVAAALAVCGVGAAVLVLGAPGSASAAGADELQVVRVRPTGDSVEVLVAVPERFTDANLGPDAFALDSGNGPTPPVSATPLPPGRGGVAVVLDNRSLVAPADLLTAKVAAVELLRGVEQGTPFVVATTADPVGAQGPTADKDAA